MKKKLLVINLFSLLVKSVLAIGVINNPIVSSKAASNQIFTEQERITTTSTINLQDVRSSNQNNSLVNSKLASDVMFKFNNEANTNLKQVNHNVNNSMVNSRLASNVIFTTHNNNLTR